MASRRPLFAVLALVLLAGLLGLWLADDTAPAEDVVRASPTLEPEALTPRSDIAPPRAELIAPPKPKPPVGEDGRPTDLPPGAIFGTCSTAKEGKALADVLVEVWFADARDPELVPAGSTPASTPDAGVASSRARKRAPIARATSDSSGRFHLTLPPETSRKGLFVRAHPPRGRVAVDGGGRLNRAQSEGEASVDLVFAKGLAGPVGGRVVDIATGEPIPECWVSVSSSADHEWIATGGTGVFDGRRDHPEGPIRLQVWDDAPGDRVLLHSEEREHTRSGFGSIVLSVPIGPSYPIADPTQLDAPAGLWSARLIESVAPESVAGYLSLYDPKEERRRIGPLFSMPRLAPASGLAPDRVWPTTFLRGDPNRGFWVRFPAVAFEPREDFQPSLELSAPARRGRARVSDTVGRYGAEVRVPLRPNARIIGSLVHTGSGSDVEVTLVPTSSGGSDRQRLSGSELRAFTFDHVEPGAYRLVVRVPGHRVAKRGIVARAGENPMEPIILEAVAAPAAYAGRASEAHVPASDDLLIALRPSVEAQAARARIVEPSAEVFGGVSFTTLGPYFEAHTIECYSLGSGSWVGPPDALYPPQLGLTIEGHALHEVGRFAALGLGGRPVAGMTVHFGPPGSTLLDMDREIDGSYFNVGQSLAWMLWAPGYQPVLGDHNDFLEPGQERRLPATSEFAEKLAKVRFQPGDGFLLYLREGSGKDSYGDVGRSARGRMAVVAEPPIANVEVRGDDRVYGVSDAGGKVLIAAQALPPLLELRRAGWRAVGLEPVVDGVHSRAYVAFFERREPRAEDPDAGRRGRRPAERSGAKSGSLSQPGQAPGTPPPK